ncbi:hypothetical protein QTN94_10540 [Vibrio sp. M250220]|uniref:hypothetical protein n=1 Tax=Vibrio sp. M250220 TaxID=3020894 RepID=UPI002F421100
MFYKKWQEYWGISYRISFGINTSLKSNNIDGAIAAPEKQDRDLQELFVLPSKHYVKHNLDDPRGFTFEFEGQQIASAHGNTTEQQILSLYNLSKEEVAELSDPRCVVQIEAGWQGKVVPVFFGTVKRIKTTGLPPDLRYDISLSSAGMQFNNTLLNVRYAEGLSEADVVRDLIKKGGLNAGTLVINHLEQKKLRSGGRGYREKVDTALNRTLDKHDLIYSVVNGKVNIFPKLWQPIHNDSTLTRTVYDIPVEAIKQITDVTENEMVTEDMGEATARTLTLNMLYENINIGDFITIPNSDYTKEFTGSWIVTGRRTILQSVGAWDIVLQVEEPIFKN